jgi:hypothetical protein
MCSLIHGHYLRDATFPLLATGYFLCHWLPATPSSYFVISLRK